MSSSRDLPAPTHFIEIPNEKRALKEDDARCKAFGKVHAWLAYRALMLGGGEKIEPMFGRDSVKVSTYDPVRAGVWAAVAQGGWEAGVRAIELIEAAGR